MITFLLLFVALFLESNVKNFSQFFFTASAEIKATLEEDIALPAFENLRELAPNTVLEIKKVQ